MTKPQQEYHYHQRFRFIILHLLIGCLLVLVTRLDIVLGTVDDTTTTSSSNIVIVEEDDIVVEQDNVVAAHGMETVDLAFENIKLELSSKKKKNGKKIILDGSIRGRAKPGRMLAIMGPSGAGKSSALHALAGRIRYNKNVQLYGTRYINGLVVSGDSMIPSALIEQDVNFFPYMTVQETIKFRVELKLGSLVSQQTRDEIVNASMEQMGLTESAGTIVGNNKVRGISGGERKRLSIAVELISSPSLIFLDEPTSGLDSTAATTLVHYLRDLADHGNKTIVAVIHQPSQHVFAQFDDILLISEGKQMFFGERDDVRTFMETHGCKAPVDMGTAEHILDCITRLPMGYNETEVEADARMDRLAAMARSATINLGLRKQTLSKEVALMKFQPTHHGPRSNMAVQFKLLLKRSLNEVFRGKTTIIINLVQQITSAFVYGGIYSIGNSQASIMDRFGLLNLIVIGSTNLALATSIRAFPREKSIISTELASKMYRTLPYFVGKAISELPLSGLLSSIFGSILYQLTGLNKAAGKFRNFLGLLMLQGLVAEAAGLFLGAISPSIDVALALFPPILILSIVFDGRNIADESIPRGLRWISKIGLMRWAYEGLCINEFTGLEFESKGPIRGPVAKTGADALARLGMGSRTLTDIIRAQTLLASTFWILSFLGLTFSRQKYEIMYSPGL